MQLTKSRLLIVQRAMDEMEKRRSKRIILLFLSFSIIWRSQEFDMDLTKRIHTEERISFIYN